MSSVNVYGVSFKNRTGDPADSTAIAVKSRESKLRFRGSCPHGPHFRQVNLAGARVVREDKNHGTINTVIKLE